MSYIPDYRGKDNEALLNSEDRIYLMGYRAAMEDILPMVIQAAKDVFEPDDASAAEFHNLCDILFDTQEVETVCSVFESADYIPEGAEIIDHNEPLYKGTRGNPL